MARQLESERERLRSALAEMLSWVDGNLNGPRDDSSSVTNISDASRPSGDVTQLRPRPAPCRSEAGGPGRPGPLPPPRSSTPTPVRVATCPGPPRPPADPRTVRVPAAND